MRNSLERGKEQKECRWNQNLENGLHSTIKSGTKLYLSSDN